MILKIKVINVWNSLALHSFAIILVPLLSRLLMSCWPHGGNTIQQCGPPQISATLGTVTRVQSLKSALMGKCTPGSSANATNQGLVSLTVDWQVSERDFERKVDFVLHIFFFYIFLYFRLCWTFVAELALSLLAASRATLQSGNTRFSLWRLLLLGSAAGSMARWLQ